MASDDIPGQYSGPFLDAILQAGAFLKAPDAYTRDRQRQAGGCPVFKAHPGVETVMVTEHVAMEAIFRTDPSVLDRQLEPGFGCLALRKDLLLDGVSPALVSHQGNHGAARRLVDEVMAHRIDAFAPACQEILDDGWPVLAGRESANFEAACIETAARVLYRWLFELDGPPGEAHHAWLKGLFGLRSDRWLSHLLAQLRVRPPGREVRSYAATWLTRVRGSEPFGTYATMGEALGLSEDEVAAHLMFAAGFNGTGGVYTTLFPALAQIYAEPEVRAALAGELAGFDGDVDALDALPYLDALMYEVMRLYGRPKQYYRRVRQPTALPTSSGEPVSVEPGDALGLVALVARQDAAVFARPQVFDPNRFLENPSLKERVFAFGPPHDGPSPYGCAGAVNGTAPRLWKTLVASLGRDTRWRLTPDPRPDIDAPTGVDPDSLMWHRG